MQYYTYLKIDTEAIADYIEIEDKERKLPLVYIFILITAHVNGILHLK